MVANYYRDVGISGNEFYRLFHLHLFVRSKKRNALGAAAGDCLRSLRCCYVDRRDFYLLGD